MSEVHKKFVPELRFPEFNDEWPFERVGSLATVKTGSKDTQDRIKNGIYPFFVRSNTVERINTYSLDCEAVITSGDGVGVGKNIHYFDGEFNYHQRVYAIYNFAQNLNGKFFINSSKKNF